MKKNRGILQLNFCAIGVMVAILVIAQHYGLSASLLFLPPPSPYPVGERLFTYTFQILCAVPGVVCAFTWALLHKLQPGAKINRFMLASALITGGFLLNEIYRIHIIFLLLGVPKLVTCSIYAVAVGLYGWGFRNFWRSTPYPLLMWGMGLLAFGIAIDTLQPGGHEISVFLEGIPKVLSEVNVVLYFWITCHREIRIYLSQKKLN
ncbi:hypothetical protein [Oscillatoria sp. FACHB-1406]|uniref:hypothetical protein n=1 Tax=Oscillatoria sp. FACHB-1406 TaxID=2692846 RepID=UPI001688E5F9|nr:hypothetical protein [Oscillatoria sp. FACHB-1406]MBD2577497.1 hypothetical protein [Oscillatoria sp. FACHB-1406]